MYSYLLIKYSDSVGKPVFTLIYCMCVMHVFCNKLFDTSIIVILLLINPFAYFYIEINSSKK